MDALEKAYELLNGEDIDVKEAEQIYLKITRDNSSSQTDKGEAFYQLGNIYSGLFDDPSEGIEFKDIIKAKNSFRLAYSKGNKEAKLELALLFSKDSHSMDEELDFAMDTLLCDRFSSMYKKDVIKLIGKYVERNASNDLNDLLDLSRRLNEYQLKIKDHDIVDLLSSHLKRIAIEIAEILLCDVETIKDCIYAKRILHTINLDNVVGEAIGELNDRIVSIELNEFADVNDADKIRDDINKKFGKSISKDKFNLYFDKLNLKLALSYFYGLNHAKVDYQESGKYFSVIKATALLNEVDDELEKIVSHFMLIDDVILATKFANYLNNYNLKIGVKHLLLKREEAKAFYSTLDKANNGDVEAKLQLADYYRNGYGVKPDYSKAIEMYKEIYYSNQSKAAFDKLFNLLVGVEQKRLLDDAKEKGISFSEQETDRYLFYHPEARTKPKQVSTYKPDYFEKYEPSSFGGMSPKYKELLAKELKRRGITRLVHFTAESNLASIDRFGILSRKQLDKHPGVRYSCTDSNRLDGELNGISISITTPNKYMLDQKIKNGQIVNPYVIVIKPELLLDPNIRFIFCESNAAKYDKNKGPLYKDFLEMFQATKPLNLLSKEHGMVSMTRFDLNRRSNETTDSQAEILVEGMIPRKYIIGKYRYSRS